MKDDSGPLNFARFDRSGRRVLTVSKDETARAWDATTGAVLTTFVPSERSPTDPLVHQYGAWDGEGTRVVAAAGNSANVWNVAGGPPIRLPAHAAAISAVGFAADGKRVLTASHDGRVRVWDEAGKLISESDAHAHVLFGRFAPDDRSVIVGTETTVGIWSAIDGKQLFDLVGHKRMVENAAFGPGSLVATASDDHSVLLWRTPSTRSFAKFDEAGEVNDAAFSPDGSLLATANGTNFISVWEVASGRLVWSTRAHGDGVSTIAFSPDGKKLLSASWDGSAVVWNASVDTRSLAELDALIRCRVPWSLENARLVQRALPASCDAR
jgi:WD40 repeat protein